MAQLVYRKTNRGSVTTEIWHVIPTDGNGKPLEDETIVKRVELSEEEAKLRISELEKRHPL